MFTEQLMCESEIEAVDLKEVKPNWKSNLHKNNISICSFSNKAAKKSIPIDSNIDHQSELASKFTHIQFITFLCTHSVKRKGRYVLVSQKIPK